MKKIQEIAKNGPTWEHLVCVGRSLYARMCAIKSTGRRANKSDSLLKPSKKSRGKKIRVLDETFLGISSFSAVIDRWIHIYEFFSF